MSWWESLPRLRKTWILVSLAVGVLAAVISGWLLALLLVPATLILIPLLLSAPPQREIDTLATRVLVPYGPRWAEYVANLVAARPSLALSLPNPIRRKG